MKDKKNAIEVLSKEEQSKIFGGESVIIKYIEGKIVYVRKG